MGQESQRRVRARIRFDYKGIRRPNRFFIGSRDPAEVAVELREKEAVLLQKVPIQGIHIENIDVSLDTFKVTDPESGDQTAFAPVHLLVDADSVEDLARFVMRDEFRTIDILDPEELTLSNRDMGRLLYQVSEEIKSSAGVPYRRFEGH